MPALKILVAEQQILWYTFLKWRNNMEIDISIDELTNCLISSETGEECDTEYRLVTRTISKNDVKMLKADGWKFD